MREPSTRDLPAVGDGWFADLETQPNTSHCSRMTTAATDLESGRCVRSWRTPLKGRMSAQVKRLLSHGRVPVPETPASRGGLADQQRWASFALTECGAIYVKCNWPTESRGRLSTVACSLRLPSGVRPGIYPPQSPSRASFPDSIGDAAAPGLS